MPGSVTERYLPKCGEIQTPAPHLPKPFPVVLGAGQYTIPWMADCKPLKGKVVLLTGGARRLGRASALALAEAGADVAITFLRSDREARKTVSDLRKLRVRAVAIRC